MEPFVYILPQMLSRKKLRKLLPTEERYQFVLEKQWDKAGQLYDTFAQHVLKGGKVLLNSDETIRLIDLTTGKQIEQVAESGWSFAKDLPDGPVATELLRISGLRAFLPVVELTIQEELGRLLDDEEKTCARLVHLILKCGKKRMLVGVTQPLRGYDKAHSDLVAVLTAAGATAWRDSPGLYGMLGLKSTAYSSKPEITFDPAAPTKETTVQIIRSCLQIAHRNVPGLLADHDTEFLHDYRVSLRKVRSVLSLFKGVFGTDDTTQLKQDFSNIMKKTNRMRDLDVYLLEKKNYFDLVPESVQGGLETLFAYFSDERQKEYAGVVRMLESKEYRRQMGRLTQLFTGPGELQDGPASTEPSLEFACRLIIKRYNKVCAIAREVDADTADEVVHSLRINCKKLRYLMEFFSPLFPDKEIRLLIKALKKLQDNLGSFNDYSVQQQFLGHILSEKIHMFKGQEIAVAEAMGALTAMLHQLQVKERNRVMESFATFDSPDTRLIFQQLFQNEGAEQ